MSGGWAAKELCEKGLKTLVLERGQGGKTCTGLSHHQYDALGILNTGEIYLKRSKKENPVVSRCYAFREDAQHFFVKDTEHPYVQEKPFDWIRGYQTGGKSPALGPAGAALE